MATDPALLALFNQIVGGTAGNWCSFDLYTVTLFTGDALRYSTADFDILWNGNLYPASGVLIDQDPAKGAKAQAHWKVGLDADTWIVVMMPRPFDPVTGELFPDKIGTVPWLQAASAGALDAADIQVDRAFFAAVPAWPIAPTGAVPLGIKTVFAGVIAEVDTTNAAAVITANDYRSLCSISMPRHFYQAQCRHTLFDSGCSLSQSAFTVSGVAGAGSTQSTIVAPALATPGGSGTYTLGTITMTSGLNKGFSATIKSWSAPNLSLVAPLPFAIVAGNTFDATPGCDWTRGSCTAFGNIANYGGQPFIPAPETLT